MEGVAVMEVMARKAEPGQTRRGIVAERMAAEEVTVVTEGEARTAPAVAQEAQFLSLLPKKNSTF